MSSSSTAGPPSEALPAAFAGHLLTPALVIRLGRVRHNVGRVLAGLGGRPDRWRPHVKTTKIPALWRELVAAGVRHFKTATTRETAVLGRLLEEEDVTGADVLCSQPLLGPALERLGAIAAAHPHVAFSVLVEDPRRVAEVPAGVDVFVDVDPGMHRTGVPAGEADTVCRLAASCGSRFRGLHWYDGHRHDGDLEERRRALHAGYDRLLALADAVDRRGPPVRELVTSGTPAFAHALDHAVGRRAGCAHRVSPGTVVLHDGRSEEENPGLGLLPAAVVVTRVLSHPARDRVTCDAGSKSLAAEAGDPCAVVRGWPGLVAARPHEEHLPLVVVSGPRPDRGTLLELVPRHVCPTVNLADEAVLLEPDGGVVTVPVAARGHETWWGTRAGREGSAGAPVPCETAPPADRVR